jgi:hypothetical protein
MKALKDVARRRQAEIYRPIDLTLTCHPNEKRAVGRSPTRVGHARKSASEGDPPSNLTLAIGSASPALAPRAKIGGGGHAQGQR